MGTGCRGRADKGGFGQGNLMRLRKGGARTARPPNPAEGISSPAGEAPEVRPPLLRWDGLDA